MLRKHLLIKKLALLKLCSIILLFQYRWVIGKLCFKSLFLHLKYSFEYWLTSLLRSHSWIWLRFLSVNHCVVKAYLRNDIAAMRVLYLLLMMLCYSVWHLCCDYIKLQTVLQFVCYLVFLPPCHRSLELGSYYLQSLLTIQSSMLMQKTDAKFLTPDFFLWM